MPFINGRYHMNPTMGQALEDARQAAEELLASGDAFHASPDDEFAADRDGSAGDKGPIHHVEIEAAEVVPSSSGRAAHGFVARVHRVAPLAGEHATPLRKSVPPRPETHVFADHRDLLDFLRSELAKDCSR